MKKVNKSLSEAVEGKVSPFVIGLREEYLRRGIPRHPKKSVEGQKVAEVQGAIVDGVAGLAFPKPDKVLRYCQLGRLLLQQKDCTQKQLQVVAGGFVYMAMFRRPLLGCLNAVWKAIIAFDGYPPFIRLPVSSLVKAEVARFLCLCPLAFVNFRLSLSPQVTASDASEFGGGVTASKGLTVSGVVASGTSVRGDVLEPEELEGVLTIGLFDGISALRVAVDSLGWNILGHVSVECSSAAQRVVESRFPATVHHSDVSKVDDEVVRQWACRFSQVALALIGAGPPCQGVSGLNVDRKGALRDQRSCLFRHVSRIRSLVQRRFPWARVATLMESVSSMDTVDLKYMSEDYGDIPFLVDAKDFSLARRPRFYWVDWELLPQQEVEVTTSQSDERRFHTVATGCTISEEDYLEPGWKRVSPSPFPTFTTSRCSDRPGRRPAGVHLCQPHELERWTQDYHRFPPYQYLDNQCVWNHLQGHRVPSIEERECILGFPKGYTKQCLPKAKQGSEEHIATRFTLLGNSWSVPVITWLIGHLGHVLGFHPPVTVQDSVSRTAPGSQLSLATFLQRPFMRRQSGAVQPQHAELTLVQKLTPMVSLKGEDLLLQSQTEEVIKYHRLRASIPAKLWKWSTAASWRWLGCKEHINVLEMRAVLCALKWRLERKNVVGSKFVHLVDSLVVLHALSRGRSSSLKLRRTLLRINSLLLATGSQAVWAYVHTSLNPADRPSRRPAKRKWRNA